MSTTIGQRWAIHRRTSKHDINHHMDAVVVEFAEQERALRAQECAEEAEKWLARGLSKTRPTLSHAILTAGTEPTNPFGCGCGWEWVSRDPAIWDLESKRGRHISDECDFCPKCGAKRRET